MEALKRYIVDNFERVFILGVLLATAALNYFVPQKLALLNFYFLPIILGGYYLGRRFAVLGAVFCLLIVGGYVYLDPEVFAVEPTERAIIVQVVAWGGFLILAGAVVGSLKDRLIDRGMAMRHLNERLQSRQDELTSANAALKDYTENLEARVQQRTVELEQSRNAMENMKQKVEGALYATMDPAVVNLMIEGQLHNEKRNLSLLFSDLVNFTSYSENHPPEVVIGELNRFLRHVEPVIQTYHGHLDKYMGDGLMCEFGAPLSYATYRTMAVVTGIKLQEQLGKLDYPWKMRVGIASGLAFTGLIGYKRQTYTAIGDVVNLAARLEQACTPGHVLIDAATYEGVADFIDARKKRQIVTSRRDGSELRIERELEELHQRLDEEGESAELHYLVGKAHLALQEAEDAVEHLERALKLDPNSTPCKVTYAEAGLQLKEQEKISVKGKARRVEAYEVVGLRDPLLNRQKIPAEFYDQWKHVGDLIKIPNDLILPIEVMDNSVGHSRVVSVLSYVLAGQLGLPETDKVNVLNAAFLADLGKEIIPHHILNRGDNLSGGELEIIRQHPVESGKMLRKLGYENPDMLAMVTHAHEQCNGRGYPQGLSGDAIPIGSRIIRVADAYDSLTSRRPYRDSWARPAALQEIRRETENGVFDPQIVELLEKLLGGVRS